MRWKPGALRTFWRVKAYRTTAFVLGTPDTSASRHGFPAGLTSGVLDLIRRRFNRLPHRVVERLGWGGT
jgi:hypothetical protein